MHTPKLDNRDRQDILEQLRSMASGYLPEWRWDDEQPDVGVIFAHLYAAMMEDTITKYNRSMYNHYLSFLNMMNVKLKPPSPAEGMVSMGVYPGSPGVYIDKGTSVYAAAEIESGRVFYETAEAVNAIDAEIDSIFFTSSARDSIVCAYRRGQQNDPVRLFGFELYPQLQQHLLYFRDDAVFYTNERTDITLDITHSRSEKHSRQLAEFFSDTGRVTWEYYNGSRWSAFDGVHPTGRGVRLTAKEGSRPILSEEYGELGLLRCRLEQIPTGGVSLTDIRWKADGSGLAADTAACDGAELKTENFSPFGDSIPIFTDFCISNREAFCKAGAIIDIDFEIDYFKTPIERVIAREDLTSYRSFMTQEDFLSDRERDVSIERVLWEYWNGLGWTRLFPTDEYEDFFSPSIGSNKKRLSFRCPDDMAEVVLGASRGPFIRARIDKLSHMIHIAGNYIAPFVRSMRFGYRYNDGMVECRELFVQSNAETKRAELPIYSEEPLVTASLCPSPAMYLCLTGPLTGGPLRIFCDIQDAVFHDPAPLTWEYYGMTANGEPGWKSIEVMDLTENLTKSAIITLVGKKDFVKAGFFGAEGYFVRLVDYEGRYDSANWRGNPVVNAIRFNTVPVVQREQMQPEYFYVSRGERNRRCELMASGLLEARVWVNESGFVSALEEERLIADPEVLLTRNAEGIINEIWVPWKEIDNLAFAGQQDRVFEVDYAEGAVMFGDGRHGRIPPEQTDESIMVRYVVCNGSFGNIRPEGILGFASKPDGVAWVTNHKPLSGGADMETIDQAAYRSSGELLGMGRLVTAEDFRRAVLASNRNIVRVKCAAHVDRYNRPDEGSLAIAVLPRQYRQGSELFSAVTRAARETIAQKAPMLLTAASNVDIFEARYVEISVSANVVISNYNLYHEVHQDIIRRLERFLDPIAGNFDGNGWEIGCLPGKEVIYNSIKTVKNIKWIKALHIFTYAVSENGKQAVEFEEARKDIFAVPVFGEPEITFTVEH